MLADLHIYNIETDFALAAKSDFYTPPAAVVRLRADQALFPATFAREGDAIMLLDHSQSNSLPTLPYIEIAARKNLLLIDRYGRVLNGGDRHGKYLPDKGAGFMARPWGWNRVIRRILAKALPNLNGLPSDEEMLSIEGLSHRRTTIPFHRMMSGFDVPAPQEFFNMDDALQFADCHKDVFFKAPWSSSGRGVIRSTQMTIDQLTRWIRGYIGRQGSVMGEIAWPVALDFATEWVCSGGCAEFVGWSVFNASDQGRYIGNHIIDQEALQNEIASAINVDTSRIISLQKQALDTLIASHYSGPLGIDCLATPEGKVNPCVEINMRTTMGHAAIRQQNDKFIHRYER